MNTVSRRYLILSAIVFMVFVITRMIDLGADLPSYFDTGISVTDEGTYIDAPRKKIISGQWNIEGEWWHSQKLTPLYAYSLYQWFKIYGVSLISARLMSVFLGIATLMVCWCVGFKRAGIKGALGLMILVGSSYILTHFNRAAMVESYQLFFIWLGIFFLSFTPSKLRDYMVGLVMSLSILVKFSGVVAWPGVLLWYFVSDKIHKDSKRLMSLVAGGALPLVMAFVFFPGFLEESYRYGQENFGRLLNISRAPYHFLHMSVRSMYLSREAPLVMLAVVGVIRLIRSRLHNDARANLIVWAFVFSVLATCCFDWAVRRYLLFMPWIYLLALYAFVFDWPKKNVEESPPQHKLIQVVALSLILCLACTGIPMFLGHFEWIEIKYIVISGATLSSLLCMLYLKKSFFVNVIDKWSARKAMVLTLLALILGLSQYMGWYINRTSHVVDIQMAVKSECKKNNIDILYGNIAPMMVVEAEKSLPFFVYDTMGEPSEWNFPNSLYLITYVKPQYGYEIPYIKKLSSGYAKRELVAGPWKMFSEKDDEREIALFKLSQ